MQVQLQNQPKNLATAKQVSIDTAMQYCEVKMGGLAIQHPCAGMNSHVPSLARFPCERGGRRGNGVEMRKKIHPRLTFAREGGRGAREMEDRVAPLKREEDLAREVKEAEIHLRLTFAHEGGGK
jgi:hypothetical protein